MFPQIHTSTTTVGQEMTFNNPSFSETGTFLSVGLDFEGMLRFLVEKVSPGGWSNFVESVSGWWNVYSILAILFSLVCFVVFIYSKIRIEQLNEIMDQKNANAAAIWAARHEGAGTRNARWDSIQQKITENSPESWKIAIIEADILLDETLTNAGYAGQSLGEKLKSANPQSFTTVQDAWEAHKVRNEIAHTGGDFVLTQKTARETLARFERVFREFDVI